jgi:hypothetical protein
MLRLLREHRTHFVATFVCCWVMLVATAPGIPIVWDEGEYLVRAHQITEWFRYLPEAFSRDGIQRHWLFINYSEGHPAGFAIPIALGQWLASPFVDPLTAARLGPITLFSIACAVVAVRLNESHGTAAAVAAPLALLTFPRIFSEAHFATQDGQLTAWWLVLWAIQSMFDSSRASTLAMGVVLGVTTATKFTGWIAWAPTALSQLAQRNRAAVRQLLLIAPLAFLIFYVLNPPLWLAPLSGLGEHFHRSLDRANTLDISTQFLGQIYNVTNPLPWYNTLVWLVFTTPLPSLVLGIVGLSQCLLTPTVFSVTLVLHWVTLMAVRALPGAPPHDGIRLFLPAFGFWCIFAAIGTQSAFNAISRVRATRWKLALRAALAVVPVALAVNVARYYPQTLSHYSLIAGGLRGATDQGMEPAYWWDALDNDVLRWLNARTDPSEGIAFSPIANMSQLRAWGRLRARDVNPDTEPFKWYVLQHRPGMFSHTDRILMRRETPVFVKYAGRRSSARAVPSDLDVPLISIFSFEQYQRARRRS